MKKKTEESRYRQPRGKEKFTSGEEKEYEAICTATMSAGHGGKKSGGKNEI